MDNNNEYYYHFTNIEYLKNILINGLISLNGENCKLVGDKRVGICVSKGISGCVGFSARFWYKMMFLFHNRDIARSHFIDTVFLRFNINCLNEKDCIVENFTQIFSKKTISPDCLKICYLKK